ncbi:MAG: cyclic nucleotide-binding domain-containing protein [Myxococcota bacterium]|nr:cyclic nucleotide-binding domain-containing protein [Myxococcota bacterium]
MTEPQVDYERIYRAVPLFADLTEEELDRILSISRLFRVDEDTALVVQGESGTGMYVLVNGSAKVTVRGEDECETTLAVLNHGDIIGELNLIDTAPHSATVTCMEASTLFHIDTAAFNTLRSEHCQAAYKVLRSAAPIVCDRLRQINERIAAIFADPERSMAELIQAREAAS